MKTDKTFYLLLQLLPQAFFALIGRAMDDAKNYVFKSVEVKEKAFRIDGVFLPNFPNDIIYFIEFQFQLDERFYARLFSDLTPVPTASGQGEAPRTFGIGTSDKNLLR